jgi:hypothetical protein
VERGRCHGIIKQYLYLPKLLQTIYVTGLIFGLDNYHRNISIWVSFSCWFWSTRDTKGKEDCGSGVFIAKDINVVGERETGDNTSNAETLLEAKSSILSSNARVSQFPVYQFLD